VITLAEPTCVRCRTLLAEDDPRTWAVTAERDFVCPNCISRLDVARGAERSRWRTHVARLAAHHLPALESTLGVLERHVRDGDGFGVRAWLHTLADESVHGHAALVELTVAAVTLIADE
jgi:hypothetical protein